MFVIILTYAQPLEKVDAFLAQHRAYLATKYESGNLFASGSQVPRTGGVILCNAPTKAEVEAIIAEDPFYKNNIATYEIIEFNAVLNSVANFEKAVSK